MKNELDLGTSLDQVTKWLDANGQPVCSCMISTSGRVYKQHTPDCPNSLHANTKICPLCRKAVEIQHTPAIDKATGKLAHDYCLRIETVESFNSRKREYIQKAAKATMTYIEQVAAKHGIDLK